MLAKNKNIAHLKKTDVDSRQLIDILCFDFWPFVDL